ncbi:hypothetical protein DNTS_026087 [Danionella cerebrum]|uniref:Peroxisomal membrane protein PMP34 n=1 Tax=Danionella cerebrum TaxID=2873325 RepID=A0A553NHY5_9TELE|nr:hypothetical protein DNTS_026087 [Danionella translucida]
MSESSVSVSLLSYETLVHAVAGAMGSVTAMTVFFPLDTARIRLQVDETRKSQSTPIILAEIVKEEGVWSLYRGWFPVISSLCCSNFVYFYTFNTLKRAMVTERSRPGTDLLMGFISGAVNVLLTTPMWVVNTRLKLQGAKFRNEDLQQTNYKGILGFNLNSKVETDAASPDSDETSKNDRGHGGGEPGALGGTVNTSGDVLDLHNYSLSKEGPNLITLMTFLSPRETTTTPADLNAFSQIVSHEGVWRLWDGVLPSLMLVFNPALQFTVYEAMKRRAARGDRRSELVKISSFEIFIFGAIAKAFATTATYPLQTVQAILRFGQYKTEGRGGLLGGLRNLLALLMDRIKRQGALGLYKGLEAKLLQTVLTAALMFVVYEKITHATFKLMGLQRKLKH